MKFITNALAFVHFNLHYIQPIHHLEFKMCNFLGYWYP